jgi:hypothetical protein
MMSRGEVRRSEKKTGGGGYRCQVGRDRVRLVSSMGVWEGVAMDSLEFHLGPPSLLFYVLWAGHPWNGLMIVCPQGGRTTPKRAVCDCLLPSWKPHAVCLWWTEVASGWEGQGESAVVRRHSYEAAPNRIDAFIKTDLLPTDHESRFVNLHICSKVFSFREKLNPISSLSSECIKFTLHLYNGTRL